MSASKEEANANKNVDIVPNELSNSVDDPQQSEALHLTITLESHQGRKCYVDPHEAFPQATYYLNTNLKRPNYYLRKEKKFNKKVLIEPNILQQGSSKESTPNKNNKKSKKRASKQSKIGGVKASKMEIDSESDDDDIASEADEEIDPFGSNSDEADDELFSAPEDDNKKMDKNFLNIFPKRNDDQKSESYELDEDKLKKVGSAGADIDIDDPLLYLSSDKNRKKKKFGAWDGVFVSCLLNIFGVIMFLRLGFIVGQAGLWYTFLIILLSCIVTTLTTLSMAAIATNGEQRAGGAYYMISRTLGPAIGGSVGFLFAIGMSIAVSMYVIGFCETIVVQVGTITNDPINDIRLYGSLLITILLLIAVFGISWIIKVQFLLLFVLILAIVSFMFGSFNSTDEYPEVVGISGWLNGNLINNFTPHFEDLATDEIDYNFFVCFGIFFPAATGIMAGANLSGDLKDASHDIPLGTLAAIVVSTVIYMVMALLLAVSCTTDGLIYNYIIMSEVSIWQPLILFGIYAATISSALTSLVGAPRIILSLSRDNLIPYFDYFSVTNADGEPIRAYIATYIVALSCIFVGHLNIVAPLITQFFLGTYAFISFACFSMSISHSPGWRPSFIYYNKYTALLGGIICIGIMLFINIEYAVVAIIIAGIIYQYIAYNKPNVNWGSAFASRAKWKANDSSLRLYQYGDHVKNFQPSFLVLCKDNIFKTTNNHRTQSLIEYVLTLRHGFGTIVYSTVLLGSFDEYIDTISHKSAANRGYYLPLAKKKAAFYEQVVSNDIRKGARLLMQLTGIGRLRVNTVVLGWKRNWKQNSKISKKNSFDNDEYVGLLMDILRMGMGFMVCRGLESLPFKFNRKYSRDNPVAAADRMINDILDAKEVEDSHDADDYEAAKDTQAILENLQPTTIDIWWLLDDGGLTLLVPHIMSLSKFWRKISRKGRCKIRVFLVAEEDIIDADKKKKEEELKKKKKKKEENKNQNNNKDKNNNNDDKDEKSSDEIGGSQKRKKGKQKKKKNNKNSSASILDIQEIARISRQGILDDAVLQSVEDSTELWKEELKALMNKFRLNILGPFTVKSGRSDPTQETITKFCKLTNYEWDHKKINGKYIKNNIKLIRWLRVSELIHAYSRHQKCTMITAPFPLSFPNSNIYLAVCDLLTQNNYNASILIRGNGQNCLTFYSE